MNHFIPLLFHYVQIRRLVQQRREYAVIDVTLYTVELLILEIADPGHEVIPQQIAQCKDDLGVAVGIGGMFADLQDGVVFQQTIEDIQSFPGITRNSIGAVDRVIFPKG